MNCRNCGEVIDPIEKMNLEILIKSMEIKLFDLKTKLQTLKNGFCDGYCINNYYDGEY